MVTREEAEASHAKYQADNEQAFVEFNMATARSGDAKAIQQLNDRGITVVQERSPQGHITKTSYVDAGTGQSVDNYQQYEQVSQSRQQAQQQAQIQNAQREAQLTALEKQTKTSRTELEFNMNTARSGDAKAIKFLEERGIKVEQTKSGTGSILSTEFFYQGDGEEAQQDKVDESFNPANLDEGLSPKVDKQKEQDQKDILALDNRKANAGYDARKKKSGQEVVDAKKKEAEKALSYFDSSSVQNKNANQGKPNGLDIGQTKETSTKSSSNDISSTEVTLPKDTVSNQVSKTEVISTKESNQVTLIYSNLNKEVTLSPDQSKRYNEGTFEAKAYLTEKGDLIFAQNPESARKIMERMNGKEVVPDLVTLNFDSGKSITLTPDQSKRYNEGTFEGKAYVRPNGKLFFPKSEESANKLIDNQETPNIMPPTKEQLEKFQNEERSGEYSEIGALSKGFANTFHSYENLGKNVGEFAQGKTEEELTQNTRPPIQDDFFGSATASLKQGSFKPLEEFGERQSKRDKYTIAGELIAEGAIWAIPFGWIPRAGRFVGTIAKEAGIAIKESVEGGASKIKSIKPTPKTPRESLQGYGQSLNDKKPRSDPFTGEFIEPPKDTKFPPNEIGKPKTETAKQPYNAEPLGTSTNLPRKGSNEYGKGTSIDYDKLFGDDQRSGYHAFQGESKSIGGKFQGTRVNLGVGETKRFKADFGKGKGTGKPSDPFVEPPKESKKSDKTPYNQPEKDEAKRQQEQKKQEKEDQKNLDDLAKQNEYSKQIQIHKDPALVEKEQQPQFKGYPIMLGEGKTRVVKVKPKKEIKTETKKKKKEDESYTLRILSDNGVKSRQQYYTETETIRYPNTEQGQKLSTKVNSVYGTGQKLDITSEQVQGTKGRKKQDQDQIYQNLLKFETGTKTKLKSKQKEKESERGLLILKGFQGFEQPQKGKQKEKPYWPYPNPNTGKPNPDPEIPKPIVPEIPPPPPPSTEPPIPPIGLFPSGGYPESGRRRRSRSDRQFRVYGVSPDEPLGFSKYGADDFVISRSKITKKNDPYLKEFENSKGLKPITGFENDLFKPDKPMKRKSKSKKSKSY